MIIGNRGRLPTVFTENFRCTGNKMSVKLSETIEQGGISNFQKSNSTDSVRCNGIDHAADNGAAGGSGQSI